MKKTAASAAQVAKCILLHAYYRITVASSCENTKKTSYSLLNELAQ